MHDTFLRALRPRPRHTCLRLPLKPLTIGHVFLLQEIQSPVIRSEFVLDFAAFTEAVFICAHWTAAEARRASRRSWAGRLFGAYWGYRCRKLDFITESKKFGRYWSEENELPPRQPISTDERRPLGAPWEWILYEHMRSAYGAAHDQALDTPISLAGILWSVRADIEGKITLADAPSGIAAIIHAAWQASHRSHALN